jgi:5-methylcytosine-specific restriction endonuclease McrA
MDGDFRSEFVREPAALKQHPALVLNADYRPLSYYPLSLWPWQDAVKAAFLDRVDIIAEYDEVARSPSMRIRIPSVVVLKDYVKPRKRVAFTRFNLFLRRCNLKKGSKSLRRSGLSLRKPPRRPGAEELRNMGRRFPPGHLHETWLDFLYWDSELEA